MVMVTDSYPTVGALMAEVLASEGYSAYYCSNECLTVECIRSAQPNLLILDLCPGAAAANLRLISQLRRHAATRSLPVLVTCTSARLLDDQAEPLGRLGCTTLIKPFHLDQLVERVSEALCSEPEPAPTDSF